MPAEKRAFDRLLCDFWYIIQKEVKKIERQKN